MQGQVLNAKCSCRRKDRLCGPSCQYINCINTSTQPATTQAYVGDLDTLDLLTEEQDQKEVGYIQVSDDDLDALQADREVEEIMHFVFREDSEEDEPDTVD